MLHAFTTRASILVATLLALSAGICEPVQAQCWKRKAVYPFDFCPSAEGSGIPMPPIDGSPDASPMPSVVPSPNSGMDASAAANSATTDDFAFGAGLGGGAEAAVGTVGAYIDTAYVGHMFRLRYDLAYGNNFPDRAEFFYAKCGCFQGVPPGTGPDPNAPGPPLPESNVDYHLVQAEIQFGLTDRLGVFIEAPVRFLDFEQNTDASGFSDLQAGFKYALVNDDVQTITFQLRTYIPTGDASLGLGTHHVSLEPGVLWYRPLTDRLVLEAELRDWIPIGGSSNAGVETLASSFAGNVLRYGIGLGYTIHETDRCRFTPVMEWVGWSVLGGAKSNNVNAFSAAGDTIINGKFGLRVSDNILGSVYAGYAHAMTEDVWYRDALRVEYRKLF